MVAANNSRMMRFASVGVINTALDFGILFLLVHLGFVREIANIISTTTAFLFSFAANRRYTFRSSGDVKREMLLFSIVTLFGLWVLQTVIIWLGGQLIGHGTLDLLITKLIATIVTLLWNYIMYARVVFADRSN